jgi:hypothetical protein
MIIQLLKFTLFLAVMTLPCLAGTEHFLEPGGVEYTYEGVNFESIDRERSGHPFRDGETHVTKLVNGKTVYKVTYTLNKDDIRISKASGKKGKSKHALLIDGSVAFGEGLNDDETITHHLNESSKIFEAYEIGFLGHGLQHNWLRFKERTLHKIIPYKSGVAIFILNGQDVRRLVGTFDHLTYAGDFPHIVEVSEGIYEHKGTFATAGTFLQQMAIKYCLPFDFCKNWMKMMTGQPTEDELEKTARFFNSMVALYRDEFRSEDMVIIWTGTPERAEIFQKYTNLRVIHYDSYDRYPDQHPTAKGAKQIADLILKEKIVY